LAIAEYPGHGQRGVVVQYPPWHATEILEGPNMRFEKCFRRLGRKGLHKAVIRVRQVEGHEVRLLLHAGNHHLRFTEVRLRLARRVRQRDEHLLAADLRRAHIVLHNRVAAGVAVLGAKPFEDALGRVSLLLRPLLVVLEDRVDRALPRAELRPPHRLLPLVARRRRILQHLPYCFTRQPKLPGNRSPAPAFHKNRPPHSCV